MDRLREVSKRKRLNERQNVRGEREKQEEEEKSQGAKTWIKSPPKLLFRCTLMKLGPEHTVGSSGLSEETPSSSRSLSLHSLTNSWQIPIYVSSRSLTSVLVPLFPICLSFPACSHLLPIQPLLISHPLLSLSLQSSSHWPTSFDFLQYHNGKQVSLRFLENLKTPANTQSGFLPLTVHFHPMFFKCIIYCVDVWCFEGNIFAGRVCY